MKRKVLGVLFTAMCLCAVPSAAYAEAQEAETTEAAGEAADEPEAGAETVTELSDSLYDFQVKIGDKVYQFPMYYQDFAADWTLGKNEDPEMGVGTNSYGSISFYKGDDRVSVDVINLGINQLPLNQCLVAGIDIDDSCEYAYTHNNNCTFIHKSVEDVTGKEIRALLRGADVKILVGCAPCQPFQAIKKISKTVLNIKTGNYYTNLGGWWKKLVPT